MQKVVGVFKDRNSAMQAREDLTVSGFSAGDIDVIERPPQGAQRGVWDKIKDFFSPGESYTYEEATRRGGILLAVNTDEDRLQLCEDILERHNPIDIDVEAESWRKTGWKPGMATGLEKGESVPLVEEQLKIGKRTLRGSGLRIHTHVTSRPVEEQVKLREESITVDRRKVDRPAGEDAFKEQVVEARGTREEPVVAKEARVVEEVTLGSEQHERTETVRESLRKTEVDIEKLEPEFQRNFQTQYGSRNLSYQDYRPAYQLGSELAMDPQFEGQPWSAAHTRVQQHSEKRFPGRWDHYKDAIRFGYEHALERRPRR